MIKYVITVIRFELIKLDHQTTGKMSNTVEYLKQIREALFSRCSQGSGLKMVSNDFTEMPLNAGSN